MKKQKMDTLLQHLYRVDITKDAITGAGHRATRAHARALNCPSVYKGWTAERWREYLQDLMKQDP